MRRALTLAAVVLAATLVVPGAEGHFGTGKRGYRSTVLAVEPKVGGLELKILDGDDRLWLNNRSGKTIVIRGYGQEPYLRFSPDGTYVNRRSPAVYLNQDRYAKTKVPDSASSAAPPLWERLTRAQIWAWHDHRVHYLSPTPPKLIRDAPRKSHHLFNWNVPATTDGKAFVIKGSLDYTPPPNPSFPVALVIALAILIGAGMVGLFALRGLILRSLDGKAPPSPRSGARPRQ